MIFNVSTTEAPRLSGIRAGSEAGGKRGGREDQQALIDFSFDDPACARQNQRDFNAGRFRVISLHPIDRVAIECVEPDLLNETTLGLGKDFSSYRWRYVIDVQRLVDFDQLPVRA